MSIQLGDKVKDSVSGFVGIVAAAHNYLNGCTRYTVQPAVGKAGTLPEAATFDEPQLVLVRSGVVKLGSRAVGGPSKYEDEGR